VYEKKSLQSECWVSKRIKTCTASLDAAAWSLYRLGQRPKKIPKSLHHYSSTIHLKDKRIIKKQFASWKCNSSTRLASGSKFGLPQTSL
jgi:hypothetical protein